MSSDTDRPQPEPSNQPTDPQASGPLVEQSAGDSPAPAESPTDTASAEATAQSNPPDPPASPSQDESAGPPKNKPKQPFRVAIGSLGKSSSGKKAKPAPQVAEPGPNVKPKPEPEKKSGKVPTPNFKRQVSPELDAEVEAALGGASLNDIMLGGNQRREEELEEGTQRTARVVSLHREDIFLDLGDGQQGVLPIRQFTEVPEPDTQLEVTISRYNAEDGLYECALPGEAVEVGDWSEISEGMIVQAVVTGHNKGGLECEVNHIRGFMPVSQVALYRVDNLEQFVGESWPALVQEADPDKRNLVLSRRAVLEREKAEAREKMLESLAVGQTYQGTVRKLMDFGAFVDIGGVDGLVHISKLSWDRINHPSEVVSEGDTIQVRVEKFDRTTNKISLEYLDRPENPWDSAAQKYHTGSTVRGEVSKLMDFGAFVRLEPGIEGLVHVSEISHKRVWRPSDVLSEGQAVDVQVQSVDADAQRISLSLKALEARPAEKQSQQPADEDLVDESVSAPKKKATGPLKGGLGGPSGGEQFGLKW